MVSQTLSGAKHNIHSENNALGGIAMPADRLQLSTLWVSKNQLRRSWKRHTNSMRLFTLLVKLFQIQQTSLVSEPDFRACRKYLTVPKTSLVSGPDFSRAERTFEPKGFSPCCPTPPSSIMSGMRSLVACLFLSLPLFAQMPAVGRASCRE